MCVASWSTPKGISMGVHIVNNYLIVHFLSIHSASVAFSVCIFVWLLFLLWEVCMFIAYSLTGKHFGLGYAYVA